MFKCGKFGGAVDQFYADQLAAVWKLHFDDGVVFEKWQLMGRLRGVGIGFVLGIATLHRKQKSGAEGLGRTEQIARVHGFAQSLHANAEIAAHFCPPSDFTVTITPMGDKTQALC